MTEQTEGANVVPSRLDPLIRALAGRKRFTTTSTGSKTGREMDRLLRSASGRSVESDTDDGKDDQ
jgi:hypothetical protein